VAATNAQRAPVPSVAEYGQLGTSNDSATFQAALSAAAAGGATVVAPPGSYRVTGLRVDWGVKMWFPGVTLVNIGLSRVTLCSGDTSEGSDLRRGDRRQRGPPDSHGIVVRGNHNRVTGAFVHDIPRLGITVTASAPSTEHNIVEHCRPAGAFSTGSMAQAAR
jgi:polygalacturonase